ncbi:hypothetical protein AYI68_g3255 [Smittium mucronatum]|uniref:Uncharacterized protein n=1 Tax=Smittium mucronatum TaxID=133383 RepID=A0A1R0H0F1_9FUNG|nr:hypothetical protein AYI68_g3255 [Smittium mucronatum]
MKVRGIVILAAGVVLLILRAQARPDQARPIEAVIRPHIKPETKTKQESFNEIDESTKECIISEKLFNKEEVIAELKVEICRFIRDSMISHYYYTSLAGSDPKYTLKVAEDSVMTEFPKDLKSILEHGISVLRKVGGVWKMYKHELAGSSSARKLDSGIDFKKLDRTLDALFVSASKISALYGFDESMVPEIVKDKDLIYSPNYLRKMHVVLEEIRQDLSNILFEKNLFFAY